MAKRSNPWLSFLKSYRAKNPKLSMKMAMKSGAVAYRKQKGSSQKGRKKKVKNKSVSFDELEGGAIRADTRVFESSAPAREDYRQVMRGAEVSTFEGDRLQYFHDALDMIPKNMYPMFQYEASLQGENPSLVKNALLKGLSGYGSHKDSSQIQKAVVHSLKHYPKLLQMYLNSKNLIMP